MKKNNAILQVFCCILVVSSCSQNEFVEHNETSSKSLITSPLNQMNPYDYYGVIHNEVTKEFVETTELNNLDSVLNFTSEINSIVLNNSKYIEEFNSLESPISSVAIESHIEGFPDNLNTISSNIQVEPLAKNYLHTLYSHINGVIKGNEISHSTLHNYILSLEETIISDEKLVGQDREFVLGTTSIARHSFYYWNDYQKDAVTKGKPYRWWQWVVVGAADALGAGVGLIAPEPTGTLVITAATAASGLGFAWMDHISDRK